MKRPLLENMNDTFIRYNGAIPILHKVLILNEKSFSEVVRSRKPFGLATNFKNFKNEKFLNSIKIYANKKVGFISKEQINQNIDSEAVLWNDIFEQILDTFCNNNCDS